MVAPPIDRGWAWMVTLGVHMIMFFVVGGFKSMGILFVEFQQAFNSDSASTALIIGITSGGMSALAPFSTVLAEMTTSRHVILLGGSLVCVGAMMVFIAPSLLFIICTYGILTGCGFGFMFSPTLVTLGRYFEKYRSTANGLAMAGGSVGQLVIPPLLRLLVDTYGYRGAMMIYSGLCLNILAGAALLRPLTFYTSRGKNKKAKDMAVIKADCVESGDAKLSEEEKSLCSKATTPTRYPHVRMATSLASLNGSIKEVLKHDRGPGSCRDLLHKSSTRELDLDGDLVGQYTSTGSLYFLPMQEVPPSLSQTNINKHEDTEEEKTPSACDILLVSFCCCLIKKGSIKAKSLFSWSLFGNFLFISYILGVCTGNIGYMNIFAVLPPYSQDIGIDKKRAALLLSVGGVCDLAGRLFGGWFADRGYIQRYNLMAFTVAIAGIFGIVCSLVPSYESFLTFMVIHGFFGGFYISLFAVVLVDYVGLERLPTGFSMTVMSMGITNIIAPALLGKLKDATGSWKLSMMTCGVLMCVCSFCFLSAPLMRKLESKKQRYFHKKQQENKAEKSLKI